MRAARCDFGIEQQTHHAVPHQLNARPALGIDYRIAIAGLKQQHTFFHVAEQRLQHRAFLSVLCRNQLQRTAAERIGQSRQHTRQRPTTQTHAQRQQVGQRWSQRAGRHKGKAPGLQFLLRLREAGTGHDAQLTEDIR